MELSNYVVVGLERDEGSMIRPALMFILEKKNLFQCD